MTNGWENYTRVKNWKAAIPAAGAGIGGAGALGELFSGDFTGSLASLFLGALSIGYMGYVNQTGFLRPQPPKPVVAPAK